MRDEGTGVYVQQRRVTLDGLDVAVFRESWRRVVQRHAVLRTCVSDTAAETPRQVVLRSVDVPWFEHDVRALDEQEQRQWLTRFLEEDRMRSR